MSKVRFVGMDVHKESVVIAVADGYHDPAVVWGTIENSRGAVVKTLLKLAQGCSVFVVCYEAGPTGYGLYRAAREVGLDCRVVAPSLVPRRSGDRIKTDRRDARKLAHFLRSGDLKAVWVPDIETEAIRDLERARDDAKRSERVSRNQLQKFLLRHGRVYSGKTSWTKRHWEWIRKQVFDTPAQKLVLADYIRAVEVATARVLQLSRDIGVLVETWSLRPQVERLMVLRGIDLMTAVVLVAEIGDFSRFSSAPALMAYLGLVPSEHSSGESRSLGGITKTGNEHVRRVLIEAAWSYRFPPNVGKRLECRQSGQAPEDLDLSWKAQQRLHRRLKTLEARRGVKKAVTAVARELAGFVWALTRGSVAERHFTEKLDL